MPPPTALHCCVFVCACVLVLCVPQAHRLKNDATLTNRALDGLACRRRVLLSGTPLQNRLDEFYGGWVDSVIRWLGALRSVGACVYALCRGIGS